MAVAAAGLVPSALVAAAEPAPAVARPGSVLQSDLPGNCSWLVWYDPWAWYDGWAGVCFTAEGLVWFDWNGGYGFVTSAW